MSQVLTVVRHNPRCRKIAGYCYFCDSLFHMRKFAPILIPLAILLFLWLSTQAFRLLSAASDAAVGAGALLLGFLLFIVVKVILYVIGKGKK